MGNDRSALERDTQLGNQSRDSRIRIGASETGLEDRSESEVDSNGREYHENIRT